MAQLFFWMTAIFAVIWAAVVTLALLLPRLQSLATEQGGKRLIIGGGVILPIVVLSVLLVFGLASLRSTLRPGADPLSLEIVGAQWWWRVRYHTVSHGRVEAANEIRLPIGRRIEARVASTDVIHSFWIPAIAGKIDMIPGRINRVQLEATRAGMYRGACAEFCGTSHARMNLVVIVMESGDFDRWLAGEARAYEADNVADPVRRGHAAFFERGCNTCHTVRGTSAVGVLGPDLTHLATRQSIAAGVLPMRPDHVRNWIRNTVRLKPEVRMPAFDALPDRTLDDLVAFLEHLR
jgi:cytochrome c oxidase subunit 2